MDHAAGWVTRFGSPPPRGVTCTSCRRGCFSAVMKFAFGDLAREPRRVGKPLRRELTGLYSARRGPYRLLYRIASRTRRLCNLRLKAA